jgi:hypothetical protein
MSEELKPCPFCGSNARLTERQGLSEVWCIKCGRSSGWCPYDHAISRWNTRPAEDALNSEITRYRRALHNLKDDCKKRMLFVESDLEKLFLYETITHIEAELDYGKDTNVPADAPDTNVGNNEVKDE